MLNDELRLKLQVALGDGFTIVMSVRIEGFILPGNYCGPELYTVNTTLGTVVHREATGNAFQCGARQGSKLMF